MVDIQLELANIAQGQKSIFKISQRRKRQKRLVTKILLDYAEHSTLHGLRYITDRGFLVFEKLFWLVMFIASLSLGCYLSSNVYAKWKSSPVMVSLSEKQVSVETVPFPSITICPQIKSKASVYRFSKEYETLKSQLQGIAPKTYTKAIISQISKHNDIALLCRNQFGIHINSTFKSDTIRNFYTVSPNYQDTFGQCQWLGMKKVCPFKRVLTAEGVCFNFNGISAQELFRNKSELASNITENNRPSKGWTPDTGYDDLEKNPFPFPGRVNSAEPNLVVELKMSRIDRDVMCNGHIRGFKIYLSSPLDLPQSSLYYYSASVNQVTSLPVNLNVLHTSEALLHYKPEVRQCYFPHEKYLRFFKIYTAKNCLIECLANITQTRCSCAGYYMPRDKITNICTYRQRQCMTGAHYDMVLRERTINWALSGEEDTTTCRCLPLCNYIEYDATFLKTFHNGPSKLQTYMTSNIDDKSVDHRTISPEKFRELMDQDKNRTADIRSLNFTYSKLEVYFKKPLFISMRRTELFGWTDLIANVGGLLALFLGFSVLSLVELLYYLTVRIGVALKRDLDENN